MQAPIVLHVINQVLILYNWLTLVLKIVLMVMFRYLINAINVHLHAKLVQSQRLIVKHVLVPIIYIKILVIKNALQVLLCQVVLV